jgi:hypothetical protein
MSPQPAVEPSPTDQPSSGQEQRQTAMARLEELRRSLQRQLRRKPNVYEKAALDRAALLALRAEIAARDPTSSSNDIVRLFNCSRRAIADFERIAMPGKREVTLEQYLADKRAGAGAGS